MEGMQHPNGEHGTGWSASARRHASHLQLLPHKTKLVRPRWRVTGERGGPDEPPSPAFLFSFSLQSPGGRLESRSGSRPSVEVCEPAMLAALQKKRCYLLLSTFATPEGDCWRPEQNRSSIGLLTCKVAWPYSCRFVQDLIRLSTALRFQSYCPVQYAH